MFLKSFLIISPKGWTKHAVVAESLGQNNVTAPHSTIPISKKNLSQVLTLLEQHLPSGSILEEIPKQKIL
jgi:hypothetical protein